MRFHIVLPKWATDLVTTKDGQTWDVVRVGMILSGLAAIGFAGWDVVVNKAHFACIDFGGGMAALFAGGGAGINLKRRDEPGN